MVGSGGASSVVSEVTSTFGAAILVSGLPQYSTANLIFHETPFNVTVSFVNPGAANILVNGVEYVITPNNQTLILRTPVHSFFLLPTNFTLTPNQDKISFLLYHVPTNATGTLIVSNGIPVDLTLSNQSTLNVSIEEFEGLLGLRSNIPGNFVLSVNNNTSGAPPIPVGYKPDLVMNLSLRSLTPGARATSDITLGYSCVNLKNLSVPFIALNGSWSQINDYVRNTTSCIISFVIPADPIVSLMHQVKTAATTSITTTASTTIIQVQPSGPTEPGVSYYLTLIVALVLFIIYYNWRLKGAKSRKFKGSASIPVVNRQEVVFLNSVFFVLGFTFVFASLGTLFQTILAHTAFALMNALRIAGGVVIVLFGMLLIASVKYIIPFFSVEHRIKVKRFSSTYLTSFVFGVAFAIGWTPCVGAILGAIYTLAATSPGIGFLLLLSFALGLGIPFLIVGAFTSRLYGFVHRIKGFLKYFNIISGLFLIAIGILVITNYIGIISVFLVGPQGPMSISENINFLLAIIAGMLTFLSPCILPLLPAFFSYMAGTTAEAAKHEN
ncbi:MAG: hypothetical protein KGH78_01540 [Candidatus Micrarchaeota archaeon]|nr:hypothetical protein [Candidatus Micrarchaeota archaeon]